MIRQLQNAPIWPISFFRVINESILTLSLVFTPFLCVTHIFHATLCAILHVLVEFVKNVYSVDVLVR